MSNQIFNFVSGETTFDMGGNVISGTNQPDVNTGAAAALGLANTDLLDNVSQIVLCGTSGSNPVEQTGQYGMDAAVITSPISGQAYNPTLLDVDYKGSTTLSGGVVMDCDSIKTLNMVYGDGVSEAIRNGFWNPVDACWVCGVPIGNCLTLPTGVTTEIRYCIGNQTPENGSY